MAEKNISALKKLAIEIIQKETHTHTKRILKRMNRTSVRGNRYSN